MLFRILASIVVVCALDSPAQDGTWSTTVDTIEVIRTKERDDMIIRYYGLDHSTGWVTPRPVELLFSRSLVLSVLEALIDTMDRFMREHHFSTRKIRVERRNTKLAMAFMRSATDTISLTFPRADLDSVFQVIRDDDHTRCFDALGWVGGGLLCKGEVRAMELGAVAQEVLLLRTVINSGFDVVESMDIVLPSGAQAWNLEWSCATGAPPER